MVIRLWWSEYINEYSRELEIRYVWYNEYVDFAYVITIRSLVGVRAACSFCALHLSLGGLSNNCGQSVTEAAQYREKLNETVCTSRAFPNNRTIIPWRIYSIYWEAGNRKFNTEIFFVEINFQLNDCQTR